MSVTPLDLYDELEGTPYEPVRALAVGGMGEVHVVRPLSGELPGLHGSGRRAVVLKVVRVLDPEVEGDIVRRTLAEGRALRALSHPNIVQLLDVGVTKNGRPYLVTELLEGRTLREEIDRRGPLPPGEVVDILVQICDGLDAAHARGLVHRDIKPLNLFYEDSAGGGPGRTSPRRVKILDFGIAKALTPEARDRAGSALVATREGYYVGSPPFMAPEQVGGREIDIRADLYSLGAVAFFLLTGKTLFTGSSEEMIRGHLFQPPRRPSALTPAVPPELDAVILRALEKDPGLRFRSAFEMQRAFMSLELPRLTDRRVESSQQGERRADEERRRPAPPVTAPLPDTAGFDAALTEVQRSFALDASDPTLESRVADPVSRSAADDPTVTAGRVEDALEGPADVVPAAPAHPVVLGRVSADAGPSRGRDWIAHTPRVVGSLEPGASRPEEAVRRPRDPRIFWLSAVIMLLALLVLLLLLAYAGGAGSSTGLRGYLDGAGRGPPVHSALRLAAAPPTTTSATTVIPSVTPPERPYDTIPAGLAARLRSGGFDAVALDSHAPATEPSVEPPGVEPIGAAAAQAAAAELGRGTSARGVEEGPALVAKRDLGKPDDFAAGDVFRGHTVERFFAAGGMSLLYEAQALEPARHDPARAKRLIKLLKPSFRTERFRRIQERLLAEGQLLRALAGEFRFLVPVHDVGVDERVGPYVVMDKVPGQSLYDRLLLARAANRPIAIETVVRLGISVGAGLQLLHLQGVPSRSATTT